MPSGRTVSTLMSPAQAAHVAGISRRTITRAIGAQALQATRDNRNQWRIKPEDLEAWRSAQPAQWAPSGHAQEDAHPAHQVAHPDEGLREEAAGLRVEVRLLREERDELRKLLTLALAQRPAPERPVEAPVVAPVVAEPVQPSRGFLARLLGR